MSDRDDLLSFISEIESDKKLAEVYGEDWKTSEYYSRRSFKAGELCLTIQSLARAEAKAEQRPGSIGARKARQKAKAYRRRLKELEEIIAEPFSSFHTTEPRYITIDKRSIRVTRLKPGKKRQYKDCEGSQLLMID